jgi:hypothetical protein
MIPPRILVFRKASVKNCTKNHKYGKARPAHMINKIGRKNTTGIPSSKNTYTFTFIPLHLLISDPIKESSRSDLWEELN